MVNGLYKAENFFKKIKIDLSSDHCTKPTNFVFRNLFEKTTKNKNKINQTRRVIVNLFHK